MSVGVRGSWIGLPMKETEEGKLGFINVGGECCEGSALGLWKMGSCEMVSMSLLVVVFESETQVKSISGNVGLLLLKESQNSEGDCCFCMCIIIVIMSMC